MIGDLTRDEREDLVRGLPFGLTLSPCLFVPPVGVDPYNAYAKVFSATLALWITVIALVAVL